jgi:hypothetical protein
MIHEVVIKPKWLEQATLLSEEMGVLRNSITRGQGNLAGFIGEIVVYNLVLGGFHENTFDYDIIKNDVKYDIKTKRCTSTPMPNYECSIAGMNPNQKCDYYIFTRVLNDQSICWVLGFLSKKEYFKKARFCKMGEVDSKSHMGWRFKADCYNVEIQDLKDIYKIK